MFQEQLCERQRISEKSIQINNVHAEQHLVLGSSLGCSGRNWTFFQLWVQTLPVMYIIVKRVPRLIYSASGMNKAPFFWMQVALSCSDIFPSLEMFKDTLDGGQSNLIEWKVSLPMAEGLELDDVEMFKVPPSPNHSMILWFFGVLI